MSATRYAILDTSGVQNVVTGLVEVLEDETFHHPDHIEDVSAVEVPAGEPVTEGWKWTKRDGFRAG
ncbi:hypothetical protein [Methylobacterium sp. Leaf93]|uniref:hypothetical protein n=1 Tax=Methylobacterium sp. Leaf93 TaxID=1736249 RepID=UPI0006FE1B33|nr:hypothetical protein [Methylobacterium sp. Leaf93]KQP02673.1 hypothetical protein ASF26_14685 [Methylobacterium sp. Leaf93]